ncbi:MAG: hypothetical protein AAB380_02560, partial [Verrucomicrobiota bacterium]
MEFRLLTSAATDCRRFVRGVKFPALEMNCPSHRFPASSAGMIRQVNLGMIGGGTVGSGVYHALQ